jgi:hypothetical protein
MQNSLGNNLATATVQYAENIGADLILVNAGAESFFKTSCASQVGWKYRESFVYSCFECACYKWKNKAQSIQA